HRRASVQARPNSQPRHEMPPSPWGTCAPIRRTLAYSLPCISETPVRCLRLDKSRQDFVGYQHPRPRQAEPIGVLPEHPGPNGILKALTIQRPGIDPVSNFEGAAIDAGREAQAREQSFLEAG